MVPVIWTEPAREQLREIQRYIESHSRKHARRMIERIIAATESVAHMPESGSFSSDEPDSNTREILAVPYRILYDYSQDHITILAVIHSARHFPDASHWNQ